MSEVLVDTGQTLHGYFHSRFFEDLSAHTVLERFVQFEYTTRGFPVAIVIPPDHENAIVVPYDDAGDTDRVLRCSCHRWVSLGPYRRK
ncbi:hypothetical protein BMG05_13250 [Mycobacterium malmoense]|nr:hypothetical protein BMG05_13250 [Mycobacterium malmoense]